MRVCLLFTEQISSLIDCVEVTFLVAYHFPMWLGTGCTQILEGHGWNLKFKFSRPRKSWNQAQLLEIDGK